MSKNVLANLNFQNKIALSAIIFILAAGSLIYFVIIPAAENIKRIKVETDNLAAQVEKDYLAGKSLKKLAENIKIIEPQLSGLDRAIIKKSASLEFITTLEKTAENNFITVKPSLGAEKKLNQTYSQIPLQLQTNGSFSGQISYLSDLEALSYYLNIKTLEISAANTSVTPSGEIKKNLVMQIVADTYWQN